MNPEEKKISFEEIKEVFERYLKVAEDTLKNNEEVSKILEKVNEKIKIIDGLNIAFKEIPLMISLVKDYISKKYTVVPVGTIVAIIAALLYVLNHFDLIPDSIPVIGYVDDIAVLSLAYGMIKVDLEKYSEWKNSQEA